MVFALFDQHEANGECRLQRILSTMWFVRMLIEITPMIG
jgi:hypothetical protein